MLLLGAAAAMCLHLSQGEKREPKPPAHRRPPPGTASQRWPWQSIASRFAVPHPLALPGHPWDLAAGAALVELAGGVVSGYGGEPFDLSSGRVLACGDALHSQMIDGLGQVKPLSGASFGAPELTVMGS